MEKYKIEANEQFFSQVLRFVKEGGVYGWPAEAEVFTKKNFGTIMQLLIC